jgi:hypothetical protein
MQLIEMAQGGINLKPRSVHFGRPLLAWRPQRKRGAPVGRALFALHCSRPHLIAAWYQGSTLDAAAAQQLWDAHPWQLIDPPEDVAECLTGGQVLGAFIRP